MKRSLLLVPLLALLAACGQTTLPDPPAPSTRSAATTTTPAAAEPTIPEAAPAAPTPESHADAPAAAEPYVVECLQGAPGPAVFSDGETRFSEWCFQELGGPTSLEVEGTERQSAQAPTGTTSSRGYSCDSDRCYWPDGSQVAGADRCGVMCGEAPTSGEMQLKNGCEGGHITEPGLCENPWWN